MANRNTKGEEKLALIVDELEKDIKIKTEVDNRIKEFIDFQKRSSHDWFGELAYCLLTAYSSALMGEKCVEKLSNDGFLFIGKLEDVTVCLKSQGHRFAERRAEYIIKARKYIENLKQIIQSHQSTYAARDWLVTNISGLGMKEASHFLRNVGYLNLAIIDRHILAHMKETGLIADDHKSITRKRYLEYEHILENVSNRLNMDLGEMDLYLWYKKTGKVMK